MGTLVAQKNDLPKCLEITIVDQYNKPINAPYGFYQELQNLKTSLLRQEKLYVRFCYEKLF